jgi:hypothetical protein
MIAQQIAATALKIMVIGELILVFPHADASELFCWGGM